MATKAIELAEANCGRGCLGKAEHDEPVFILRAQDILAPNTIEFWADHLQRVTGRTDKIDEARELAKQMRLWQIEHINKLPD